MTIITNPSLSHSYQIEKINDVVGRYKEPVTTIIQGCLDKSAFNSPKNKVTAKRILAYFQDLEKKGISTRVEADYDSPYESSKSVIPVVANKIDRDCEIADTDGKKGCFMWVTGYGSNLMDACISLIKKMQGRELFEERSHDSLHVTAPKFDTKGLDKKTIKFFNKED